jgi:probable HAF family extracellular repeat protein
VDVRRAIASGYRRRRLRRVARSAGVVAVALAVIAGTVEVAAHWPARPQPVVPAVTPPSACPFDLLALPSGDAMHVDPTGTYISVDVVLWHNGHQVTMPMPAGAANVQTNGINAHGVLVGMAQTGSGKQFAFVYRDGKATKLPALSGYSRSTAWGINAGGDIVGAAFNDGDDVPVLWPAAAPGTVHRLRSNGTAYAIGDDGTIVGTLGDGDVPWVFDRHGSGHALPTVPGAARGKAITIRGDWAGGWAGDSGSSGGPVPAARWNLRTGAVQTFASIDGPATGVNVRGDLVNGGGNDGPSAIRDGKPLQLAAGPDPVTRANAAWISDDGRTLIGSLVGPGPSKAVVWHC